MEIFTDISILSFLAAGYAEIHYHLPWLYPAYYRRLPEIIADLPHRLDLSSSSSLPLLIILKDAHLFPVFLSNLSVQIIAEKAESNFLIEINKNFDQPRQEEIFYLDLKNCKPDSELKINIKFFLKKNGKKITFINDNLPALSKKPFKVWLAKQALNLPDDWFAGDPHYHSRYTSDQVEFGAGIYAASILAKALGLHWFCVTDHSYDLDDKEDDYTSNDPALPLWHKMKADCRSCSSPSLRIIAGEEVSIGNHKDENVHLLALNYENFIAGHGDSAEVWGKNKPQHSLSEITDLHNSDNLFIAAHPLENVPLSQKITLRRGNWSLSDYQISGVRHLQLINSNDTKAIDKYIKIWSEYLLSGNKFFIMAGNDAHGNFNVMRQIKLPFLSLWESHKQIFGNWLTIFQSEKNDPLPALKAGRMIVSNGPFLSFFLRQLDDKWLMGETCPLRHATVEYEARTATQFGEIDTIYCYRGDCSSGKEFQFPLACPVNIALPQNGYIRLSLITTKGYLAFTNPVFTSHLPS